MVLAAFEDSSNQLLGPSDSTNTLYLGGPKKIVMNAELMGPFPGAGNDRTLRLYAFTDIGRAFGENEKLNLSELRSSFGVGLSWISPIGTFALFICIAY